MSALPPALHFSDLDCASDPWTVGLGGADRMGLEGVRAAGLLQPGPSGRPWNLRRELEGRMVEWLVRATQGLDVWLGARWIVPDLRARSFLRRLEVGEGDWHGRTPTGALESHVFAGLEGAAEGDSLVGAARVRDELRARVLGHEAWRRAGWRTLIALPPDHDAARVSSALAAVDLGATEGSRDLAWLGLARSLGGVWVSGQSDIDQEWHLALIGDAGAIPALARERPGWAVNQE